MERTKGTWVAGFDGGVTGPTTPRVSGPCCGGEGYPFEIVSYEKATIAICPKQVGAGASHIANADFICKSVNFHDRLVSVAREFRSDLEYEGYKDEANKITDLLKELEG